MPKPTSIVIKVPLPPDIADTLIATAIEHDQDVGAYARLLITSALDQPNPEHPAPWLIPRPVHPFPLGEPIAEARALLAAFELLIQSLEEIAPVVEVPASRPRRPNKHNSGDTPS